MVSVPIVAAYAVVVFSAAIVREMYVEAALAVIVAVPTMMFVVRTALAGARPTAEGIFVRNIRSSRLIPWEEIDQFRVGALGAWARIGVIDRCDGVSVGIWGC